jgi:hypothetical protein
LLSPGIFPSLLLGSGKEDKIIDGKDRDKVRNGTGKERMK